jgi:hypothetical protein
MPYYFEFDARNTVLQIRFEGVLTDQALKEYYVRASERVPRVAPRAVVTDFTGVTSFSVSVATMHTLASSAPTSSDPHMLRIAIAPAPHVFGMVRMFQILGESTRPSMHVVQSRAEALALLGVRDLQFEPLPGQ